jgi:hypothetical protein
MLGVKRGGGVELYKGVALHIVQIFGTAFACEGVRWVFHYVVYLCKNFTGNRRYLLSP